MPIFSTAYFPSINYLSQLIDFENIEIEIFETYPKQTYRNRAIIATANGLLPLSVPVEKTNGNHTITKDITICNRECWQIKHWRAIESAYNSSPYFLYYQDDIKKLIFADKKFLIDLNADILAFILKKLNVKIEVDFTQDFDFEVDADFRNLYSPKVKCQTAFPSYQQVFEERFGFQPNLSILDLLFNLGPEAKNYFQKLSK